MPCLFSLNEATRRNVNSPLNPRRLATPRPIVDSQTNAKITELTTTSLLAACAAAATKFLSPSDRRAAAPRAAHVKLHKHERRERDPRRVEFTAARTGASSTGDGTAGGRRTHLAGRGCHVSLLEESRDRRFVVALRTR